MAHIPHYEQHAARLVSQYESLAFQDVHAGLPDLLPPGATVLDVGAGSGRDAAWFAVNGHDVVAVEPSDAMLGRARELLRPAGSTGCRTPCPILRKCGGWD